MRVHLILQCPRYQITTVTQNSQTCEQVKTNYFEKRIYICVCAYIYEWKKVLLQNQQNGQKPGISVPNNRRQKKTQKNWYRDPQKDSLKNYTITSI